MKPVRTLVLSLLGYAAALVPGISQAHGVELALPGVSVRLPAPPILPLPVPQIVVRGGYTSYDRGPEYRRMPPPPPRYYREDWRHSRWDDRRYDHHDHHDHGRHGGWRR
ncbi:hypothetical protein VVD49_02680 [Uliginosibacterium sp. H3]|uniref:Uncharacterized protein n=1 Tax=Uliginosibacterium silvisoli TaxID=3114758 RepID=A0ABU6JYP0_9RHOO|nr:hypothetical protein [Uliginosibacterium sp. H3]